MGPSELPELSRPPDPELVDLIEPAFLEGQIDGVTPIATPKENAPMEGAYLIVLYGAGTKSRTRDLLITNQLCNRGLMRPSVRFL